MLEELKTEYPGEFRIWDQPSGKTGLPAVYVGPVFDRQRGRYPLPPWARYPRAIGEVVSDLMKLKQAIDDAGRGRPFPQRYQQQGT